MLHFNVLRPPFIICSHCWVGTYNQYRCNTIPQLTVNHRKLMISRVPLLYFCCSLVTNAFSTQSLSLATQRLTAASALTTQHNINSLSMSTDSNNAGLTDIGVGATATAAATEMEPITTWREKIKVSMARSRKVRGGNFVQIATVDPETLEPRCRTVVFRGFLKQDGHETI